MHQPTPIAQTVPATAAQGGLAREMQPVSGRIWDACLTAFLAGVCIMSVELVAGNVIAGTLGGSIHTWTSVIGVIMTGIALGNWLGGTAADRFNPQPLLAGLFIAAGAGCAAIEPLNQLAAALLDGMDVAPPRIAAHVALVFLPPSLFLGAIGPCVARFALDRGGLEGRTVGSVYASHAAGSIVGTFLTGFFLTPLLATSTIVLACAGALAFIGMVFLVVRRGAAA